MLLVREEEALERAALCFAAGDAGLVLVVCARTVRSLAWACLSRATEMVLSPPRAMHSGEEVIAALSEDDVGREGEVFTLGIPPDDTVVEALNWHREKLRRRRRPVLLWMDAPETLAKIRERAPDAYSFRDDVVEIEGFEFPQIPLPEEPASLRRARRRYERAKSSREGVLTAVDYVTELREVDAVQEAMRIGDRALGALEKMSAFDEELSKALRRVAHEAASAHERLGAVTAGERLRTRAVSLIRRGPSTRPRQAAEAFLAMSRKTPPFWFDPAVVPEVVDALVSAEPTVLHAHARALVTGVVEAERCRLSEASSSLACARSFVGVAEFNEALTMARCAFVDETAGRLVSAERLLRDVVRLLHGRMAVAPIQMLTTLLVSAGELGVASRFVEWLPAPIDVDYQCASRLMVREGRIDDAVHLIEADLRDAVLSKRDLSALKLATLLVESGERARDAEVAVDLARLDALLAKEAEALYAFTDPFPWYRVMMPSLRARLLARSPDTLERAIELQRASFERANTDHPHIAPSRGCLLADHLVRAGRHTEALPVCDEAEALARARLRPRDLAETLAVRLRALVALEEAGALRGIITQNVDRLHQRAGSQNVVELHGSIIEWRCTDTGELFEPSPEPMATFPPASPYSKGALLRPNVVWFGEALPEEALLLAFDRVPKCDLFFTIGTSSQVYPAAGFVQIANEAGAKTVEINKDATTASGRVDVSLRGGSGELLGALTQALGAA
jgi:NAD-dependent SIR2 family protein deacetylase